MASDAKKKKNYESNRNESSPHGGNQDNRSIRCQRIGRDTRASAVGGISECSYRRAGNSGGGGRESVRHRAERRGDGEEKGKFLFDGHHFELRRAETFDFIGKPQKYTMAEGVAFRQKTAEQTVLKAKSAAITKALKAIKDAFPETHPNIEPDSVEFTVVCVD